MRPTAAQMKAVYETLPHRTVRKLAAALVLRGFKTSGGACQRAIANGFKETVPRVKSGRNPSQTHAEQGEVKGMKPEVKQAEAMVGNPLRGDEIDQIAADLELCKQATLGALREMQERERLTTNILLMKCMQRKADRLVLIPKDVSVLVQAMTEAERPAMAPIMPEAAYANGYANGHTNGTGLIDVTPSKPINEMADAIGKFLKAEGVAA